MLQLRQTLKKRKERLTLQTGNIKPWTTVLQPSSYNISINKLFTAALHV